jgi:Flp pilus assembly protein TadG
MHSVSPHRFGRWHRISIALRAHRRGQSLVEFALVLPIMLLILVIAADFGRLFFTYIQVTNAAREGAGYASLHAADDPFDQGAFVAGAAASATGEANAQGQTGEGGLTVEAPVCFNPVTSATLSCNAASDFADGIGNYVRVTVREDFSFLTPIISSLVGVLPLNATATAPVLNPPVAPPAAPPGPTPGSLVVTKTLAGDLTDFRGGEFTFAVLCNGVAYGPVTINLTSGSSSAAPITGIPAGVTCTVTETDKANAGPRASWDNVDPKDVAITEGTQSRVTFTNTRTYSDPVDGSLVVTKVLDGDLTGFGGGDFTFSVSCDGTSYGPVTINLATGSRSSDPIVGIPDNAVCTVTETDKPSAGSNASWNNPGPEQVTIQRNRQADAVITNTRTYIPPCTEPRVRITPESTTDTKNRITVDFSGTAAGTPTSWSWDFGDGTVPEAGQNASHTFIYTKSKGAGPQTWTIILTTEGSCAGSAQATVTLDWR